MTINGLQKLTLLDFPGHVACTVFTSGCTLRCPFCHNALLVGEVSGAGERFMENDEFFRFLEKRRGILDGVAFTGGEPLMARDFVEFALRVKSLGFAVKLDTNGTFPRRLRDAIDAGAVDYVAMDIKNSPAKYALTCGMRNGDGDGTFVERAGIAESAALLLSGAVDYEFRTTVVKEFHTADDFHEIGRFIRGAKRYFLQQFRDSGNILGNYAMTPPTREELEQFAAIMRAYVDSVELRGVG